MSGISRRRAAPLPPHCLTKARACSYRSCTCCTGGRTSLSGGPSILEKWQYGTPPMGTMEAHLPNITGPSQPSAHGLSCGGGEAAGAGTVTGQESPVGEAGVLLPVSESNSQPGMRVLSSSSHVPQQRAGAADWDTPEADEGNQASPSGNKGGVAGRGGSQSCRWTRRLRQLTTAIGDTGGDGASSAHPRSGE